jgi:hypothetical protein
MQKVFSTVGGRKISIFLLGFLVLALNDKLKLGLGEATLDKMVELAKWVVGAVAVEDGMTKLLKKGGKK